MLLAKQVELKPETTYRITADIWADSAEKWRRYQFKLLWTGGAIRARLYNQSAVAKGELGARTNVDEQQELYPARWPWDGRRALHRHGLYFRSQYPRTGRTTLRGSGLSAHWNAGSGVEIEPGDVIGQAAEQNSEPQYSASNFDYNEIGAALFGAVVVVASCFLLSGRNGARIGEYCRRHFVVIVLVAAALIYRFAIVKTEPGALFGYALF